MFPASLHEGLNRAQFTLRDSVLGRLKLRPGLPPVSHAPSLSGELEFYRMILDAAISSEQRAAVTSLLDIGCRNWSYAPALAEMFPNASLLGIELDGGRRYWNLHRRIDQARAHARKLTLQGRHATALHADFLRYQESPQGRVAFTFFYPFVSDAPCLAWGLPSRYADFTSQLTHALGLSSAASPWIVSCHQGDWEGEIARESYRKAGLTPSITVIEPERFAGLWPSPHPAVVLSAKV